MRFRQIINLSLSKYIVAILLIVNCFSGNSQNLVLNPSFETTGTLLCSWYTSEAQYSAAVPNWTSPTGGSPDVFSSTLAASCYCATNSTHADNPGPQAPRTGNNYSNVVVYGSGGCTPYREYIQGTLSSALVVGTTYEVEMYVSLGDKATVATSGIGFKFNSAPVVSSGNMCVYNTTPDVVYNGPAITDFTNWTRLLFYYTPTVPNQRYFIIGNFTSDASTCTTTMPGGTKSTIRYYIDDVSVKVATTTPPVAGTITNANVEICTAESRNLFTHLIGNGIPTNGTWTGPSTLTGGHLGTFTVGTSNVGTYTYSWSAGTGACASSGSARVTVTRTNPVITLNPIEPLCRTGSAVTLGATPSGGTFSGVGVTGSTFNPTTAGEGTHTITYALTGNCPVSSTTSITVNNAVPPTLTPIGPFCAREGTVLLNATPAGGTWSGTGVTGSSFNTTTAGAGTHTLTYNTGGVCPSNQTMSVLVNNDSDATINPLADVCVNSAPVNLTALFGGGTWSGISVVGSTFYPNTAGVGTHTITYAIDGDCPDTKTATINVLQLSDATINPVQPVCTNAPLVDLSAINPGGTWSGNGVAGSTFSPSVAGAGTHTVTYTIGGACPDTRTTSIVVNQFVAATINPLVDVCVNNNSVSLTSVNAGGTWSGNGVTGSMFNPSTAGVGSHTITYAIEGTCPDIQTATINVLQLSDATINPVQPLCTNAPLVDLSAINTGGTWSGSGVSGSTFNPSVAGAGTHTITYSIGGLCPDMRTTSIVVNQFLDATINPLPDVCSNFDPINLTAINTGGTWSGNGVSGSTFNPVTAGVGTHTITYAFDGACPDTKNATITVVQVPNLQMSPFSSICTTAEAFSLYSPYAQGQWSGVGVQNNVFSPINAGVGVHQLTYTVGGLCPAQITLPIEVNSGPLINLLMEPQEGCAPVQVTFSNTLLQQDVQAKWIIGDTFVYSTLNNWTMNFTEPGCYDLKYIAQIGGCVNEIVIPSYVCVEEVPVANFSFQTSLGKVDRMLVEYTNLSTGADTYKWDFEDYGLSTLVDPTFYAAAENRVINSCLIAKSNYGCVDTICKAVPLQEPLIYYVPNSFTPDGDAYNQNFKPIFSMGFDPYDYTLIIYNRWGEMVFESHDHEIGWNGMYGAQECQDGVYTWTIYFKTLQNDEHKLIQGSVNLMR